MLNSCKRNQNRFLFGTQLSDINNFDDKVTLHENIWKYTEENGFISEDIETKNIKMLPP